MVDGFENLNFPQRSDGHAFLLVVHKNTLQSDMIAIRAVHGLVYFTSDGEFSISYNAIMAFDRASRTRTRTFPHRASSEHRSRSAAHNH